MRTRHRHVVTAYQFAHGIDTCSRATRRQTAVDASRAAYSSRRVIAAASCRERAAWRANARHAPACVKTPLLLCMAHDRAHARHAPARAGGRVCARKIGCHAERQRCPSIGALHCNRGASASRHVCVRAQDGVRVPEGVDDHVLRQLCYHICSNTETPLLLCMAAPRVECFGFRIQGLVVRVWL